MQTKEALDGFLMHISGLSTSIQQTYTRVLECFAKSAPKYLTDISAEHIEKFLLSERRKKNLRASTANLHLMAFKSWFSWLEKTHNVHNIARLIKPLRALPPQQRIITQKEYEKLIETTEGNTKDVIQFLGNSGLRASEFLSLKPENIGQEFITLIGKGGKLRKIPINKTLRAILERDPAMHFIKSRNKFWLYHLCCKAARKAQIQRFSPHSLRHYFCSELIKRGVPRFTVSKLMGDTIQTIDKVYIHLFDADLLHSTDVLD